MLFKTYKNHIIDLLIFDFYLYMNEILWTHGISGTYVNGILFVLDLSSVIHHNEIRHFAQAGQLDPREVNRRRTLQTMAIFCHKRRGMRSKIRRPAYILQG